MFQRICHSKKSRVLLQLFILAVVFWVQGETWRCSETCVSQSEPQPRRTRHETSKPAQFVVTLRQFVAEGKKKETEGRKIRNVCTW